MKAKILTYSILILGFLMIFSSCKKDDDFIVSESLSGTEWKKSDTETSSREYSIFKFVSRTTVEAWYKMRLATSEYKDWTGIYYIDGNKITIDNGSDDLYIGIIDGDTMTFADRWNVISFIKL